jgi:hypothetical protein
MSFRSPKLLKAAQGMPCMSCGSVGTTVSAHCRMVALGSGTGIKVPDCLIAWLCQSCHDKIDGRTPCEWNANERRDRWFLAFARTIVELFKRGIVEVT